MRDFREMSSDPHSCLCYTPLACCTFLHGDLADGAGGKIGFINSVSEPFCDQCNRIRITADGKLRTCLFSIHETDLQPLVRGGKSDSEIAAAIRAGVWDKDLGHKINQLNFVPVSRSMSQIGG
ncbi:MAG: hypothetical protein HY717_14005 [Planctomycetes bacterium]|nr:hypothetical protein [Planctomycetota bacterium]